MMRKELLLAILLAAVAVSPAQVSVRTRAFSFGKPVLGIRGDFLGENGTNWLNANGEGTLVLSIFNNGTATSRGTVVTLSPVAQLKDVQIVRIDSLGDIKPGEVRTEKITVSAPEDAKSQKGAVAITVRGEPGPVSAETIVEIAVREVPTPHLDVTIVGAGGGATPAELSKIKARVRNTGTGEARGVSATFLAAGPASEAGIAQIGKIVPLGTIAQGSSKEIPLTLKPAKRREAAATFVVRLDEERPRFSVSETLSVQVKNVASGTEEAGFAAFKKGDYNQAIASFERVAAAGAASKEVYFALGFSYFKNRNRARSLSNMQRSAALGSVEAKGWLNENTVPVEITTVTYRQINPDPFEGLSPPVGLGVLPFTDSLNHDTPLTQKLYDALKAKNESFRIFPFSTIKSEQESWGLTGLSPSSERILNALEKELSMNFGVAGVIRDPLGSAFSMQLIRCSDAEPVVTQEFRTSKSSTAIDDAVMLLLKGKVPVYTASRTLEVKFP